MKPVTVRPVSHIYVCTNDRGTEESCCKRVGGHEFFSRLKAELTQKGLRSRHWITRTGCLGFCNDVGCVVAIYRDGENRPTILSEMTNDDYGSVWKILTEVQNEKSP